MGSWDTIALGLGIASAIAGCPGGGAGGGSLGEGGASADASVLSHEAGSDDGAPDGGHASDATVADAGADAPLCTTTGCTDSGTGGNTEASATDAASGEDSFGSGEAGTAVVCPSPCPSTQVYCDRHCVDRDDPEYGCGTCNPCVGGNAYQSIPTGVTSVMCVSGACAIGSCMQGRADCDGQFGNGCETDLSSPLACGTCGRACSSGQVCDNATCMATCPFGKTDCSGACHDITSDPAACGQCGSVCNPGFGTATCGGGKCSATCNAGFKNCTPAPYPPVCFYADCGGYAGPSICTGSMCSGACVDEQTDANNCGGCGTTCPMGDICVAGQCTTLVALQLVTGFVNPVGIAVDIHNVYVTDPGDNSVWQVDKTTGAKTELATNQHEPWRIAVDATSVYWSSTGGGAIVKTAIGSTSFQPLYSTNKATGIYVDDTNVYWSQTDGIYSAPKAGGGTPKLLSGTGNVDPLYATRTQLVFTASPNAVDGIDKVTGKSQSYFPYSARLVAAGCADDGDDADVFWGFTGQCQTSGCTVQVCDTAGCDAVATFNGGTATMVSEPCRFYWGVGSGIYWANPHFYPERALLLATIAPEQLALDDKYVYWVDKTWIGRVPK